LGVTHGCSMAISPLETLLALKAINLLPGLNSNDRRIGVALIEHFNRKTGRCDPGLGRIAALLGISKRTVIRSIHRLESVGLFKKTRHGGHFNRNSYEPIWPRFRAILALWDVRLRGTPSAKLTTMSPAARQDCHLGDDDPVTQTCTINLPKETYRGPPRKKGERAVLSTSAQPAVHGKRSRDAAESAAERRWTSRLHEQFVSKPVTYGEIIELITPELQSAATKAEMRRAGTGLEYVLKQLGLADAFDAAGDQSGAGRGKGV
jgi:hypothetical protein